MPSKSIIQSDAFAIGQVWRARSEPELRAEVVRVLRANGIDVDEQVSCAAGVADIVTARRDVIIECKIELTRRAILMALAQLLIYSHGINPAARMIIVGYRTDETAALIPHAAALGVEIACWENTKSSEQQGLANGLLSPISVLDQQPISLGWNVQTFARAQNITTVVQLAQAIGTQRQSLYQIWRGHAQNVALLSLERLANGLKARPGDWFILRDGKLHWSIRSLAEQVGLDRAQFAFKSSMYPQAAQLFWSGTARYALIQTLERLATTLDSSDRRFDVGDLFRREAC